MSIKDISKRTEELLAKVASIKTAEHSFSMGEKKDVAGKNGKKKEKGKEKVSKQVKKASVVETKVVDPKMIELAQNLRKVASEIRNCNFSNDISYQDVAEYVKLFNK